MKFLQAFTLILVAALLGACSSTQVADNASPVAASENQVASAETASSSETMTCRTVIKTGTRIGTRLCKPNREWEQDSRTSREAVDSIQRESTHTSGMIGN